jgi:hypothetical protein
MSEVKLYPSWKEAVKTFMADGMNEPGTVIDETWKLINFDLVKPETGSLEELDRFRLRLLSAFESFREELLTTFQVHLKSIGQGSHIVLPPNEQTREAWKDGIEAIRSGIAKMKLRLGNVDYALLTHEERKENTDAQVRQAMLIDMFRKVRKKEIAFKDQDGSE